MAEYTKVALDNENQDYRLRTSQFRSSVSIAGDSSSSS